METVKILQHFVIFSAIGLTFRLITAQSTGDFFVCLLYICCHMTIWSHFVNIESENLIAEYINPTFFLKPLSPNQTGGASASRYEGYGSRDPYSRGERGGDKAPYGSRDPYGSAGGAPPQRSGRTPMGGGGGGRGYDRHY